MKEYLQEGGFPRTLQMESGDVLRHEYFTDIIERDVKRHVAARQSTPLIQLAKMLLESTGSESSLRNFAKTLDISIETVKTYIYAFASAYLILPCPYFTFSEKKRLVRPHKYYPIDTGLMNSIVTKTGNNLGKSFENAVYLDLRSKHKEIYYWRGQGEVDFVITDKNGITPYQVTWEKEQERHLKALAEFKKEFPQSNDPIIITRHSF